jgi:HK97 family phage prohead protease
VTAQTDRLIGTPEWRGFDDFEVRSQGNEFIVRGYAALFDHVYPVGGGPDAGGWNEQSDREAFDKTLRGNPDVHFLINHTGVSLARTKSGTLKLGTDSKGLDTEARIDRRLQDGRDLEIRMERGDLDEMSYAFRTMRQEWQGDLRTLLEVNMDKGDVSVVNNGANDATRIHIASPQEILQAVRSTELAEVRGMDDPLAALKEARTHLDALIREVTPQDSRSLSIAEALRVIEGLA